MLRKICQCIQNNISIVLLIVIAFTLVLSSLIPQNMEHTYYIEKYKALSGIIIFFNLDKILTSIGFKILIGLSFLDLIIDIVNNLPGQIRRMKKDYIPEIYDEEYLCISNINREVLKSGLNKKGFKVRNKENILVAFKNKFGNISLSIVCIGFIAIIIGGILGDNFCNKGLAKLQSGDIESFRSKGFSFKLDDFHMKIREDGSTEQYFSDFTILDGDKKLTTDSICVNKPFRYKGLSFFQSDYGYINELKLEDKEGKCINNVNLASMNYCVYEPKNLAIFLYGYYPDLNFDEKGMPYSVTDLDNNPYYAVILYHYKENIGSFMLEPKEKILFDNLMISFEQSTLYTEIIYKSNYYDYFILLGFLLLIIGLIMSIYFYPMYIVVEDEIIKICAKNNAWRLKKEIKRLLLMN